MSDSEVHALKETVGKQQVLLQKLYSELEAEREASASATNEALSMILRLQGEKSVVKMELSQYQRMAEEKINHSNESVRVFEELVYQHEMEIASLQCQIQAYRYKLISLGFSDTDIFGNPNLQRGGAYFEGLDGHEVVIRSKSLPSVRFKEPLIEEYVVDTDKDDLENSYSETTPNKFGKIIDYESDNFGIADIYAYGEQIKQLQERAEEQSHDSQIKHVESDVVLSHSEYLNDRGAVSSPSLEAEDDSNSRRLKSSAFPCSEFDETEDLIKSVSVQDIYEVPQTYGNGELYKSKEQDLKKQNLEDEIKLGRSDSISHITFDYANEDKSVLIKKLLRPRHDGFIDFSSAFLGPTTRIVISEAEVQQLQIYLKNLEREKNIQEAYSTREEELMLLRKIHKQLNTLKSDMRSSKNSEHFQEDDSSLVSLMEAMWFCDKGSTDILQKAAKNPSVQN